MINTNLNKYNFNFPNYLLSDRVTIALSKYINEFYISFKYLKSLMMYIIEKRNNSYKTIKDGLNNIANQTNKKLETIQTAINKIYGMFPKTFFEDSPLHSKIKMNYLHKTQFVLDFVLKNINKPSMI